MPSNRWAVARDGACAVVPAIAQMAEPAAGARHVPPTRRPATMKMLNAAKADTRCDFRLTFQAYGATHSMSEDGSGRDRAASAPVREGDVESTAALLERARAGDSDAANRLFARHVRPLQRWASGRLPRWARDVTDTDDLVQETLLQTFKRIGQFEPRGVGALHAYLRQAILNRIREELRREGSPAGGTGLSGLDVENHLSPLDHAIGTEAVERYETGAGAAQARRNRKRITGRVELGYTYEELARALGKPTADAARKAAQRALARLVEEMERGNG